MTLDASRVGDGASANESHADLGAKPIEPGASASRIFVSHCSQDAATAGSLVRELETRGRHCWIARRDIPVGANYASEIVRGMKESGSVVVLLSSQAVESAHVRREVNLGIDLGKTILPLSLDPKLRSAADLPGDWSYWLGLVQIYPFSDSRQAAALVDERMPEAAELGNPQLRSSTATRRKWMQGTRGGLKTRSQLQRSRDVDRRRWRSASAPR